VPAGEGLKYRDDREVAGLYDGARFDLPHRRDGYVRSGSELFLSEACLLAQVTQPPSQLLSLLSVRTVCASFPSRTCHLGIIK
jgi:hypothetical protein